MTYLEDWLAHLFQKPYEKPGVCICTQSDEEGTGKDTFWGFIGQMVGSHMYFNTSRPEDTVFGRFNGSLKEVMLIKFEEANFETNKKNEDALKSLITSTDQSYEAKNENAVTLNSYCRLVMTTNHTIPFVLTDVSRRFMMLKVSAEKVGDRAYWTRVHTILATPEARNAYYDYLMKRDISKFNPGRHAKRDEAKTRVIKSLRTEVDLIAGEIKEHWPVDVISAEQLKKEFDIDSSSNLGPAHYAALDRYGIASVAKQAKMAGRKKTRYRIIRNHDKWEKASSQEVFTELDKGAQAQNESEDASVYKRPSMTVEEMLASWDLDED
jgi:hypothetical protein